MEPEVVHVDYTDRQQTEDLLLLLNDYASDPMGGGQPLDPAVGPRMIAGVRDFPTAFSLLIYVNQGPAALANCFFGFSTFAGRKLINIHDLMVRREYRGRGLSQVLLREIEKVARQNDCCKLTLEVLSGNEVALESYRKFGFGSYQLDPDAGQAVFWEKKLT